MVETGRGKKNQKKTNRFDKRLPLWKVCISMAAGKSKTNKFPINTIRIILLTGAKLISRKITWGEKNLIFSGQRIGKALENFSFGRQTTKSNFKRHRVKIRKLLSGVSISQTTIDLSNHRVEWFLFRSSFCFPFFPESSFDYIFLMKFLYLSEIIFFDLIANQQNILDRHKYGSKEFK